MVETRTPRYDLPQWGDAATDAPDMADFNHAFAQLDAAPIDLSGTAASRPGPGVEGRYFFATDTLLLYRDDGTAWRPIGSAAGDATPQPTGASTGAAGTAAAYAREDHRHGFTTGTPTTSTPGDTAGQGTAAAVARSDHRHGREAALLAAGPTDIPGQVSTLTGTAGGGTAYARSDHRHEVLYGTPSALPVGSAVSAGTAYTLARSDHVHAREQFGVPGTSAPGDTAAAGSAATVARSDHRHGRESSTTAFARADITTFNLPSGAWTIVNVDNILEARGGLTIDAAGNSAVIPAGMGGVYQAHLVCYFGTPTGTPVNVQRAARITNDATFAELGGGPVVAYAMPRWDAADGVVECFGQFVAAAGTYIAPAVYQATGAVLNAGGLGRSLFSVVRVGD